MLELNIEKRDTKSSLETLREGGQTPAVFYGKNVESTPVLVSASDFIKVWKEAGSSAIVTLKGVDEDKEVVIYDIDIDPVTSKVRHIDFYVIERGKAMEIEIPLEYVGVAPAVKSLGGILVKVMHTLQIEVLPKDLPQNIEVDISSLEEMDSQILVKDLKLPESAKPLVEMEDVVAAISVATEEEEVTEEADITSVEIEKKGKKEEEEIAE